MKARILILFLAAAGAWGQAVDNTVYVKQFPGTDVGTKVANAQKSCNPSPVIPCILVIDPSLAAAAPGTLPTLCPQCTLFDYRVPASFVPTFATASMSLSGWGDSLTSGNQDGSGVTYLTALQSLLDFSSFNGGESGDSSTQIATRMLAATSHYGDATILWAGRNNNLSGTTVQTDLASMVTALTTPKRCVVLSIPNENVSTEWSGQANYASILALNTAISNNASIIAPGKCAYLDIRSYLISQYNPADARDVIDHGHDVLPTTLRAQDANGILIGAIGSSDTAFEIGKTGGSNTVGVGSTLTMGSEYIYISAAGASNGYGALQTAIGTSDTTLSLTLNNSGSVSVGQNILIDSEVMHATGSCALGISPCSLTVTRGYEGTSAAIHAMNAPWSVTTQVTTAIRGYASSTAASHSALATWTGIDPLHLGANGYTLVAQQVNALLRSTGAVNYLTQQVNIADMFASPPPIGVSIPPIGSVLNGLMVGTPNPVGSTEIAGRGLKLLGTSPSFYSGNGSDTPTAMGLECPDVLIQSCTLRFFRTTNTTGVKAVYFFAGDGSNTPVIGWLIQKSGGVSYPTQVVYGNNYESIGNLGDVNTLRGFDCVGPTSTFCQFRLFQNSATTGLRQIVLYSGGNPSLTLDAGSGRATVNQIGATTLYSAAGTALPSCASGIKGVRAVVSDATAPTYMGAYTSGGAITAEAICSYNGTTYAWLMH